VHAPVSWRLEAPYWRHTSMLFDCGREIQRTPYLAELR
jgi:hypothetical protein